MPRTRSILAFLCPVSLAWLVTLVFSFSGFASFVFAFLLLIPGLVISLVSIVVLSGLWLLARRNEQTRTSAGVFGALALGIAVGVVAFIPLGWLNGALVYAARQPVRELLAVRVIKRSHARGDTRKAKLQLHGIDALLSQDGEIEIYPDVTNTSVVFWNTTGIMSGDATVYAEDARATHLPTGLDGMDGEHESGHWWHVWEEQ